MVDRLVVRDGIQKRLSDSIENVLKLSDGLMTVDIPQKGEIKFSQSFSCPDCGISIDEIEPRNFSFNNPFGACEACHGLGFSMEFTEELIVPDPSLSIPEGALAVPGWQSATNSSSYGRSILDAMAGEYGFDLNVPYQELSDQAKQLIMHGTDGKTVRVKYTGQRGTGVYDIPFEGVIHNVERRYRETASDTVKKEYESFMKIIPCKSCKGKRLKPGALAVTVGDKNIAEVTELAICDLVSYMNELQLTKRQLAIGELVLREIHARLGFLMDVGLGYLSLARNAGSLSGGEAQRIRLATQIGRCCLYP